ncbi:hypothetical protein ACFQZE_14640 [Paenibacillus sp. GCM10027627]
MTHNAAFSEFTIIVDKEAYENGIDSLSSLGIVAASTYYQLFNGAPSNDLKVAIHLQDHSTNKIFSSEVHPH